MGFEDEVFGDGAGEVGEVGDAVEGEEGPGGRNPGDVRSLTVAHEPTTKHVWFLQCLDDLLRG